MASKEANLVNGGEKGERRPKPNLGVTMGVALQKAIIRKKIHSISICGIKSSSGEGGN